jgi:hypothetical protein
VRSTLDVDWEIIKGGGRERKRAIAMIAVWRMFRVSCLMSDSFMSVGS